MPISLPQAAPDNRAGTKTPALTDRPVVISDIMKYIRKNTTKGTTLYEPESNRKKK